MGFIYPHVLWLLLLIVPVLMAWSFSSAARERRLSRFVVRENWALLSNNSSARARFHKGLLIVLALTFSVVAAARPYWGTREREVRQRGVNILFAVDVSNSMRARDIGTQGGFLGGRDEVPSRLAHARQLVRQVLLGLPGQRAGLMPFAGEAFLQTPLTTDYGLLQDMVRALNFDVIGTPGSNFPALLDEAIRSFENSGEGTRVLVLLSDGEDHSQAMADAAKRAAEQNIRIFAMGIGTTEGAPITMEDGSFKETREGTKVLTRLNPDALQTLAEETGGHAYIAGTGGRLDPAPLIADLQRLEKGEFGEELRVVREERYQWPLALALLCLAAEMMLRERRNDRRRAASTAAPTKGATA